MDLNSARKFHYIPSIITFSLVFILGVTFLILSIAVGLFNEKIPSNYLKVEATITNIEERPKWDNQIEHIVYIEYSVEQDTYKNVEYGKYDSFMKVGDKVTIYVNPEDTSLFMTGTSDNFIFPLLSGIFTVIGAVGDIYCIKKLVDMKRRKE